ncbi:hypothetical protein C8Q78DRAFT_960867 [Trametes maxima]|nr:hypothetical protein C8Q78DRAFT_960867 [Trametes maxima]
MDPTDQQLARLAGSLSLASESSHKTQRSLARGRPYAPHLTSRSPPRFRHDMTPEQIAQYLQEYSKWSEEDRKIPPEPSPVVDRNQLITDQLERRTHFERLAREPTASGAMGMPFYMTMVGFPKHSSSTPVQHLARIPFSNMLVRRVHTGHYLLCRVITPCSRMVAIQTVVEDPEGAAHELSIYNFPSTFDCSPNHLDVLFAPGTILAIREPTLKAPTQGNRPLVRVDSPTDISFVLPDSSLLHGIRWRHGSVVPGFRDIPRTWDEWQQRGNEHFKASRWFLAAFAFSHALLLDSDATVLRLNRTECYLRLKYYSGAIHDAYLIMSTPGVPESFANMARFRLARARYGKGDYRTAESDFVKWRRANPGDNAADPWIDRCHARLQESMTGKYDWGSLFRNAKRKVRVDAADFFGPVHTRRMERRGGGRGMVATRDIQAGELLLAAKPYVSVYACDLPPNQLVATLDLLSKSSKERTDSLLLAQVVEKLYGDPDTRDEVFHLYAGPTYPPPPDSYPPRPRSEVVKVDLLEPNVNVDIAHLEAICTYNNFCPFRLEAPLADRETKPTGLYTLASMFNHSCAANAIWYCIGDLMVIRAAGPIRAGSEITIPYSVEESYFDRQNALRKHMLDNCSCALCEDDRKDGEAQLRRRHELKSRLGSRNIMAASVPELCALEKEISMTYAPTRGLIRPLNALALHVVAEKLRSSNNARFIRESLDYDMRALECYGFVLARDGGRLPVMPGRIPTTTSFLEPADIMLRLACSYSILREEGNAARWLRASLWLTDVSVGGGKELFMLIHEETLQRMDLHTFAARAL